MTALTAVGNGFSIIRPTFEESSIGVEYQAGVLAAEAAAVPQAAVTALQGLRNQTDSTWAQGVD